MVEISGKKQIIKEEPFSEETLKSLYQLGEILRQIHTRVISEGYVFKDDKFILLHDQSESKNK